MAHLDKIKGIHNIRKRIRYNILINVLCDRWTSKILANIDSRLRCTPHNLTPPPPDSTPKQFVVTMKEPKRRQETAIKQRFTMRAVLICLLVSSGLVILSNQSVLRRKRGATQKERNLSYSNPRYGSSYYYEYKDIKGSKGSKSAKGHPPYGYHGAYKKSKASKSSKKGEWR
jgi:hypothetical protein